MICALPTTELTRAAVTRRRALLGRHAHQFHHRSDAAWQRLAGLFVVTYRPGDRSASFGAGKWLRPLGSAVLVTLQYAPDGRLCTFSGVRGRLGTDRCGEYGHDGGRAFQHDIVAPEGQRRSTVSTKQNPELAELLLRMDLAAEHGAERAAVAVPQWPRIWWGFAAEDVPPFAPSPALVRLAAAGIGIAPEKLLANPPPLVERLLEQTWDEQLLHVDDPRNCTGLTLVDAELCSQTGRALRVFEDFRGLIGVRTWNPAEEIVPYQRPNPTAALLAARGLAVRRGWEEGLPAAIVEALLEELRTALGDEAARFDEEDLCDALVEPFTPVTASSIILPQLRKRLKEYWSACVTDDDLRAAARRPNGSLGASGACRFQVLRQSPAADGLRFDETDLGRRARFDMRRIEWRCRQVGV